MKKVFVLGIIVVLWMPLLSAMGQVDARGLSAGELKGLKFGSLGLGLMTTLAVMHNVGTQTCATQPCAAWAALALFSFTVTMFAESAEISRERFLEQQRLYSSVSRHQGQAPKHLLEHRHSRQK